MPHSVVVRNSGTTGIQCSSATTQYNSYISYSPQSCSQKDIRCNSWTICRIIQEKSIVGAEHWTYVNRFHCTLKFHFLSVPMHQKTRLWQKYSILLGYIAADVSRYVPGIPCNKNRSSDRLYIWRYNNWTIFWVRNWEVCIFYSDRIEWNQSLIRET